MMDDKEPAAARVRAAEALLDRGWGKPAQQISGEFINRDVRELSTAELGAFLGAHVVTECDEPPAPEPLNCTSRLSRGPSANIELIGKATGKRVRWRGFENSRSGLLGYRKILVARAKGLSFPCSDVKIQRSCAVTRNPPYFGELCYLCVTSGYD